MVKVGPSARMGNLWWASVIAMKHEILRWCYEQARGRAWMLAVPQFFLSWPLVSLSTYVLGHYVFHDRWVTISFAVFQGLISALAAAVAVALVFEWRKRHPAAPKQKRPLDVPLRVLPPD